MTEHPHPAVGDHAPDFALPDLNGSIVSLAATRAQSHVVVHFVREFT